MNIEELKLILEAVSQLGAQGKEAFIWWLILETVPSFLIWSGIVGAIYYVISTMRRSALFGATEEFFKDTRDILGIGCGGYLTQHEMTHTQARLRELAKASKAQ